VSVLLLACRLALAGTFLVAGSAKLADLPGARAAAAGMRVPRPLARAGMPALAGFELVIGLGLVPAPSARYAAVAAAVTILGVTAVAGNAIGRGLRVECHCFGRLGGGRIGAATLVRNAAILALAAFVAIGGWAHPDATAPGWLDRPAATIAEFAALLLLAAATAGPALSKARSRGPRDAPAAPPDVPGAAAGSAEFARTAGHGGPGPRHRSGVPASVTGPGIGSAAPDFRLDDLAAGTLSLRGILSAGDRVMLAFVDMRCGECVMLIRHLAGWQRRQVPGLTIAVVAAGERSATVTKATQHRLERVGHDPDRTAFGAFGVLRTPAAVLLDPDGTVRSPVIYGTAGISSLVAGLSARARTTAQARLPDERRAEAKPLLPIRRPIPPAEQIVLRAADGQAVGLLALLGPASLAIFIRPECIFSRRLLPELQKLPARDAATAPELVLICYGDPRDMGLGELRLPVFTDISGAAGPALGATGTPAAVLTRSGRPVAPAVSGAARVLAAARGETPAPADCGCARR
jgi:methylamine utilization protein MauE/AhpC/TSA family protein